ncbi:MAG: NifU family protein [Mycoplasmatota bacterium]|nr:NifU family protein [Mycoplasmatota bacterium]
MKSDEITNKIILLIDKLKPFLINDGGNLEFVKYEDNIVYVRMLGACKDCAMMDITLKEGIEEIIVSEIPEVKEVRNID